MFSPGFPDAKHDLEIVEAISENRAIGYWSYTGTHAGLFFDFPASGNHVSINGVDFLQSKTA